MNPKEGGRRRFLKGSAALAGLALGAIRSPEARGQTLGSEKTELPTQDSRAYGKRSRFETSVRRHHGESWATVRGWNASLTPLQDQMGILTPSSLHFDTAKGYAPPDTDPRQYRLLIHGLVDRPLIFTLEELKRLPSVSRIHFIECGGNTGEGRGMETAQLVCGKTGCSEWTGVLLSVLLRETGVQKGASWLVAEGAEVGKHTRSIPLGKALEDVLVAYGQNGEAVRPENGYPVRLVVPGWLGNINVKWLRRIKVVDQPYMTKWESVGYIRLKPDGRSRWFFYEMGPKSIITFPSGSQRLPSRGFYEITGLAWSGGGAVRRVEISTDGGRNWKDAELQEPVLRHAHTRFRLGWNWDGEEVVLRSRCTDELGQVQPTLVELSKLWGVSLDFWQTEPAAPIYSIPVENFNPIQSWKVTREGSVENALFS